MFIVNVEGAVYQEGKWLLIQRSTKEEHAGGTLSLIGGKVETEGNTYDILEDTVRREIYEEVGVEVKDNLRYLYSSSFVLDDGRHVINAVFVCEYERGTPHCKSQDEVDGVFWMTYEEVLHHPNSPPWLKESLQRAQETTFQGK